MKAFGVGYKTAVPGEDDDEEEDEADQTSIMQIKLKSLDTALDNLGNALVTLGCR